MSAGQARRDALVALVPAHGGVVVDVGADHGRVAAALGAIATEREPHRRGSQPVPWVIADGLSAFRGVDVAVIAGMGARTIAEILTRGPSPATAVLHAQDDPSWLRVWLAAHGWRIDAERLAPEGRGFAELIRAVPGRETATGERLALGPRLLDHGDPLLLAHLTRQRDHWETIVAARRAATPDALLAAKRRLQAIEAALGESR